MLNCTRGVLIRVELNLYFSSASASLLWFFQKTTGGPGVAPFGSPRSCPGGIVSLRKTVLLLAVLGTMAVGGVARLHGQQAQSEIVRRAKSKVEPIYPDLARKMNITGTVKVAVVVAPNGTVKEAKLLGGHPVLANAALDAVRKWRFEPAAVDTSGVVDFKFDRHK